jgi:hypothetical protein
MQFDKKVGEVHLLEWANAQEGERRRGGGGNINLSGVDNKK